MNYKRENPAKRDYIIMPLAIRRASIKRSKLWGIKPEKE
jgi:hypothetical protein